MTARLVRIVRHPIKAIGHEELDGAALEAGRTLPWDRHWAVAHTAAKFGAQPEGWAAKMNFLRGVAGPELMAITAAYDEAAGRLRLSHPRAGSFEISPGVEDDAGLIDWLRPLWPEGRPDPARLVSAPGHAMTDVPYPYVSVLGTASLDALSERAGHPMSPHRFRGNLWVEGWEPFAELGLVGRNLRLGEAELTVEMQITRCEATHVSPESGARDTDTLGLLKRHWGHQEFGVYARVTRGGRIAQGDAVEVLA